MYLDTAATTPVRREVLEAMWPYLAGGADGVFGNPSSTHEVGERAAAALADARAAIAAELGCRPGEVVFTAGGTEGDNLAIKGIALANPRGRHLVISPTEHEAVRESADFLVRFLGFELTEVPVDRDGVVTPAALAAVLRPETTLVSIAHASNEIGTVQDIRALAAVAHGAGAPFHTDAVQSAGWLPVGLAELGVDALTIAGHKLGAPKGIGVLAIRSGIPLEPVLHGGGQERGRRSGTENVAGAVGLAAALRLASAGAHPAPGAPAVGEPRAAVVSRAAVGSRVAVGNSGVTASSTGSDSAPAASATLNSCVSDARDALIDGVLAAVPTAILTGSRTSRLPNHASFCFPGTSGEAVLLELERAGITVSSGSACAAGSDEPSPALLALGIPPDVAQTAVRFTFPHDATADAIPPIVAQVARAVAAVTSLRR